MNRRLFLQHLASLWFFILASLLGLSLLPQSCLGAPPTSSAAWQELEPGLEHAEFRNIDSSMHIVALRIDPEQFTFFLCSSAQFQEPARTLKEWAQHYNLTATINASMYLRDGITSTGFMKDGGYINNKRIGSRLGGFFVADPDCNSLPKAAVLDRQDRQWDKWDTKWHELLRHYRLVIQNYRIIDAQRQLVWPEGGDVYAISAIAQEDTGKILFLHSISRLQIALFGQMLLQLPLQIKTVLYVEGGRQAGLFINTPRLNKEVQSLNAISFLMGGDLSAKLPNALGIKRKTSLLPKP